MRERERLDGPGLVLPGGWVLLDPRATLVCVGALGLLEQTARRDGGRPSPDFTATLAVLREAASSARSDAGVSASVPPVGVAASSSRMLDPVTTGEAARMLGCTAHNARDLCRRGVFASAVRRGALWLVERDEVAALAQARRGREEAAA